ncbi:hypothetical protein HYT74_03850 [Candidatus Daviesbacteria bacterium]|nr:hypothetical protein [Candidatus Daviesbacteria bacterium]MBI4038480.1 hypothetical protein [Candidatus Daviesbacteria bacterium]
MGKEYDILNNALIIAEQAWNTWIPEVFFAKEAIGVVESYPHIGKVGEGIYIGKQRAYSKTGQVIGLVVDLTAIGEGAISLAQDPSVRCVVLERNPNIRGFEDATRLTIDRTPEAGGRFTAVFGQGLELGIYRADEVGLAQRVIENITRRLV